MVLFGAGGHGKVILSILQNQQIPITIIIDDDRRIRSIMGYNVINSDDYDFELEDPIIISIGNNLIRSEKSLDLKECSFGKAIHTSAVLADHVVVQPGSVIMPHVVINPSTSIGKHCILNSGAIIEHDCQVGDFVHIAPNTTVCGECEIGEGSLIGAGAVILPSIRIGNWCRIGAGAVVTKHVPDGHVVVGNPAKIINAHGL